MFFTMKAGMVLTGCRPRHPRAAVTGRAFNTLSLELPNGYGLKGNDRQNMLLWYLSVIH